jgi:hypothetical protein
MYRRVTVSVAKPGSESATSKPRKCVRYFPAEKTLGVGNVPSTLQGCDAVRSGNGGGYGRVFEFIAASDFGELIAFLLAGNRSDSDGRYRGDRGE